MCAVRIRAKRKEVKEDWDLKGEVRLEEEQDKDEELVKVKSWVRHQERPMKEKVSLDGHVVQRLWGQFDSLALQDGVLVRKAVEGGRSLQYVVPAQSREEVVRRCHEGGHWGKERTKETVKRYFYWPRWEEDVETWVSSCQVC